MKILYAIQGTGNGHLSRARDIYPELQKYGHVDIIVSGYQGDVALPFPVKYKCKGLSFIFGKQGGVSHWQTFLRLHPIKLIKDITSLPVGNYDLVVNDFEPVSAWACKYRKVPCISLSHQAAVLQPNAPKPAISGNLGKFFLNNLAPTDAQYGFHFIYDGQTIFPPVIRSEIQKLAAFNDDHYTVYLPSFSDEQLIKFLHPFENVKWQVFSKHTKESYVFKNISIQPINNETFLQSLGSCTGTIMGAGFEGPAEALYLKKKLLVIPMLGQYEQYCNAAALEQLGIPVIYNLGKKYSALVQTWLEQDTRVDVEIPKKTASVAVQKMMLDFAAKQLQRSSSGKTIPGYS